mgnify:CR=1 FL=1
MSGIDERHTGIALIRSLNSHKRFETRNTFRDLITPSTSTTFIRPKNSLSLFDRTLIDNVSTHQKFLESGSIDVLTNRRYGPQLDANRTLFTDDGATRVETSWNAGRTPTAIMTCYCWHYGVDFDLGGWSAHRLTVFWRLGSFGYFGGALWHAARF